MKLPFAGSNTVTYSTTRHTREWYFAAQGDKTLFVSVSCRRQRQSYLTDATNQKVRYYHHRHHLPPTPDYILVAYVLFLITLTLQTYTCISATVEVEELFVCYLSSNL